jgi:hypothetical protein
MIKRLNVTSTAANLLEPYQPYAKSVSGLDQSLSRDKHWTSIRAYLRQHKNRADARSLQYSTWPVLVANVESALDLVSTMYSLDEGELLHDGLTFATVR